MKKEANLGALNDLMMLLMPHQVNGLKRKEKKEEKKDEKPLSTVALVEDDSAEEPSVSPRSSISFSEISVATKKEPKSSNKQNKRKGRRR